MKAWCEATGADAALATRLAAIGQGFAGRLFHAATPSFRSYDEDGLAPCGPSDGFPAFSITGGACALDCKHCRAGVLKGMLAAGTPAAFEAEVRRRIQGGMNGFLLSGGSDRAGRVAFDAYLPAIERLKRDYPALSVLVHTGLVEPKRARALKAAGVDVAMLDIIGAEETIAEVYHLDRRVEDFAASLAALVEAGVNTVPHVVIGLHFGRMLGERRALDIIRAVPTKAAILVVLMPHFADAAFSAVDPHAAGALFGEARAMLDDRLLLLGCGRPPGRARQLLDGYATLAGLDGIAFPDGEAYALARRLGRPTAQRHACCGLDACRAA